MLFPFYGEQDEDAYDKGLVLVQLAQIFPIQLPHCLKWVLFQGVPCSAMQIYSGGFIPRVVR